MSWHLCPPVTFPIRRADVWRDKGENVVGLKVAIFLVCLCLAIVLAQHIHVWSEVLAKCQLLSCVRLFSTPWTIVHQAPLSMKFSRQEYLSGLPFPSLGHLFYPGIEPGSPTLQTDSLQSEPRRKPKYVWYLHFLLHYSNLTNPIITGGLVQFLQIIHRENMEQKCNTRKCQENRGVSTFNLRMSFLSSILKIKDKII